MLEKLIEVSTLATTLRTLIFTAGHFVIDTVVIAWVTGAPIEVAGLAGLLAPLANGVWFWTLDRWWSQRHADDERQHLAPQAT